VKQTIEYLETALKKLGCVVTGVIYTAYQEPFSVACNSLRLAIIRLKNKCCWETPEQYEERTGEKWPNNGAVYCRYNYPNTGWTAWEATSYEWAKSSLWEKQIVIATESGPPPDDWKQEEME
jgi:hypothetical protein